MTEPMNDECEVCGAEAKVACSDYIEVDCCMVCRLEIKQFVRELRDCGDDEAPDSELPYNIQRALIDDWMATKYEKPEEV